MSKRNERIAAYLRKSTKGKRKNGAEDKEKQAESIPGQRETIERWAEQNDHRIEAWYVDEKSGGRTDREQWLAMREAAIRREIDTIVITKLDRFSRMDIGTFFAEVQAFRQAGVRLISVSEGEQDWHSDEGLLMLTIRVFQAAKFRPDISENVSKGMLRATRNGKSAGGMANFGYRWEDKKLVPDPVTAPILKEIFDRYARRGESVKSIARWLREIGVKPQYSDKWNASTVVRILRCEKYLGRFIWNETSESPFHFITKDGVRKRPPAATGRMVNDKSDQIRRENDHEPLVDRVTFDLVQRRLAERYQPQSRHKGACFLFSGKVYCAQCGHKMHARINSATRNPAHNFYVCSGGEVLKVCRCRRVNEKELLRRCVDLIYDNVLEPLKSADLERVIGQRVRLVFRTYSGSGG